jgi:uncharacterized protein YoxC
MKNNIDKESKFKSERDDEPRHKVKIIPQFSFHNEDKQQVLLPPRERIPEYFNWIFTQIARQSVQESVDPLEKRVEKLEKQIQELRQLQRGARRLTKADEIYELHKDKLEAEHFGKIIAIDTEKEEIVGMGNSVIAAYNDARKNSSKTEFEFRRVGYRYVYKR